MLDSGACGLCQHERGKDSPVSETAEKRAGRGGAEAAECDSGPGTIRLHTALQLSAAGMSGEQYVAKAGQIPDEKKENGQKKGEISAVTKLRQQERQRRGKLFLVFGGLLFLSTALVCILPVRKRKT